ncbi:MAG: DMT family transporter [Actinomycetota bacterium]|jgi:hypothetical protein|nr:DMT family transporter [Actinomycetota bacterium]
MSDHHSAAIALALAAAAAYGVAAALQHHAAAAQRAGTRLLSGLVRRPLWLLGNALDGVGFVFQFLALRRGSLLLVEPLLVLSLVFALPIASWLDHQRVSAPTVVSALVVSGGLALFLVAAQPGDVRPDASRAGWALLTLAVAALCAALAGAAAVVRSPSRAAVLLAGGSGTAFGYVAAVAAHTGHVLDRGALHTLATPAPYALAAGGAAALVLTQRAFAAGALHWSLPTLTVAQPLAAIGISLGLFDQHMASTSAALAGEVLGLLASTAGIFVLGRAPAIAGGDDTVSW